LAWQISRRLLAVMRAAAGANTRVRMTKAGKNLIIFRQGYLILLRMDNISGLLSEGNPVEKEEA